MTQQTVERRHAIPELSLETQQIERVLLALGIGEFVAYEVLSATIQRDVQTVANHHLTSARRRLLREPHRRVYEAIRNVGIKRLDDVGKVATSRSHARRSFRQAGLAIAKARAVDDFDALPRAIQIEHNTVLAQAGAMRHFGSARMAEKVAKSVESPAAKFSLSESLSKMTGL